MSKRVCPFEENCTPQLKMRIFEKEQAKTKQEAMEIVWNRTQELLYKGAKKQFDEDIARQNHNEEKCDFCLAVKVMDLHDCKLCNGAFCPNCSLKLYKDNVTETVCLSCAD